MVEPHSTLLEQEPLDKIYVMRIDEDTRYASVRSQLLGIHPASDQRYVPLLIKVSFTNAAGEAQLILRVAPDMRIAHVADLAADHLYFCTKNAWV